VAPLAVHVDQVGTDCATLVYSNVSINQEWNSVLRVQLRVKWIFNIKRLIIYSHMFKKIRGLFLPTQSADEKARERGWPITLETANL
jgi:hypothetical protein